PLDLLVLHPSVRLLAHARSHFFLSNHLAAPEIYPLSLHDALPIYEGRSLQYIANYLGFSKTTVFNELHRLNSEYQAELAQTDFEQKFSQRGRKSSLTKNLKHLVEERIQVQKWSTEQVAHVVGIAYKTVYNWIDQKWLGVQLCDLADS